MLEIPSLHAVQPWLSFCFPNAELTQSYVETLLWMIFIHAMIPMVELTTDLYKIMSSWALRSGTTEPRVLSKYYIHMSTENPRSQFTMALGRTKPVRVLSQKFDL